MRNLTHCKSGHPFTPENTYYRKDTNGRQCRQCRCDAVKDYRDTGKQGEQRRLLKVKRQQERSL